MTGASGDGWDALAVGSLLGLIVWHAWVRVPVMYVTQDAVGLCMRAGQSRPSRDPDAWACTCMWRLCMRSHIEASHTLHNLGFKAAHVQSDNIGLVKGYPTQALVLGSYINRRSGRLHWLPTTTTRTVSVPSSGRRHWRRPAAAPAVRVRANGSGRWRHAAWQCLHGAGSRGLNICSPHLRPGGGPVPATGERTSQPVRTCFDTAREPRSSRRGMVRMV